MDKIRISVIVPIYNAEKYLKTCLESLIGQTYENLDILLIDDGSTDNSLAICRDYQDKKQNVRVIHQENRGLVFSRKLGMKHAVGDYVTFVDADDYLETNTYEVIVHKLEEYEPDILAYEMIEECQGKQLVKHNHFEEKLYCRDSIKSEIIPRMLCDNTFFEFGIIPNIWCKVFKRNFLENTKVFVSENVSFGEDVDFGFQYMAQANSLYVLSKPLYHYCKHSDSMVGRTIAEESIQALEMDLTKGFMQAGVWDEMQGQMKDYMKFVRLLKNPKSVKSISDFFAEKERVALYGAGGYGTVIHMQFGDKISLWVDGAAEKYSDMVFPIKKLLTDSAGYDCIYIAILNENVCREVSTTLHSLGVEKKCYWIGNSESL